MERGRVEMLYVEAEFAAGERIPSKADKTARLKQELSRAAGPVGKGEGEGARQADET